MGNARLASVRPSWALAVPVLAGIGWMAVADAPVRLVVVNAAALVIAILLGVFGLRLRDERVRTALSAIFVALLFLPLVTGPHLDGVSRWIALGPLNLHSGMLFVPAIAMFSARGGTSGAGLLGIAALAAFLQPDPATGIAIACAASALFLSDRRRWPMAAVAIVALIGSAILATRDALAPVAFVEYVIVDAAPTSVWIAACLAASLVLFGWSLFRTPHMHAAERDALGGALLGFVAMALVLPYPTPLVGYGAAPILGYGLAFALARRPVA